MNAAGRVRGLAVATALLLVSSLLGLVVVSRSGSSDEVALDLRATVAATRAVKTARISLAMRFETQGTTIEATGEGALSLDPERSMLRMQSPVFPTPMEFVADGTTAYVKATAPPFDTQAKGKPWVSFDVGGYRPPVGMDPMSANPMQMLAALEAEGAVRDVRADGEEEVRGARTTRYVAVLDLGRLIDMMGNKQAGQGYRSLFEDADARLTLFVGDDDIVRRTSMRLEAEVAGQDLTVEVTSEFFDFGAPVTIVVPPADQVTSLGASPLGMG